MKTNQTNQDKVICIKAETTFQDVKEYANSHRELMRQRVLKKFHEAGVAELPLCDLGFEIYLREHRNPYDEIKNVIAQFGNAVSDGYFFYLETVRLRRELERLKARPIEDVKYKACAPTVTCKESEACNA